MMSLIREQQSRVINKAADLRSDYYLAWQAVIWKGRDFARL